MQERSATALLITQIWATIIMYCPMHITTAQLVYSVVVVNTSGLHNLSAQMPDVVQSQRMHQTRR